MHSASSHGTRSAWGPAGGCALATGLSALLVISASLPELKDLNSSMTTPEMAREIEELRKDCASYTEKLERIKSATNHVTPEEKEKVKSCLGLSQALAAEPRWANRTDPLPGYPVPSATDSAMM